MNFELYFNYVTIQDSTPFTTVNESRLRSLLIDWLNDVSLVDQRLNKHRVGGVN